MGVLCRRRAPRNAVPSPMSTFAWAKWVAAARFPLALLAVIVLVASGGEVARAAHPPPDAKVAAAVDKILDNDVANANYGDARRKLRGLIAQCKRKPACQPATVAKVHIAQGIVSAQLGQNDDAKALFIDALHLDPSATLPDDVSLSAKKAFAEAQKAVPPPPPQPAQTTPTVAATAPAFDLKNKQAADLAQTAVVADSSGMFDQCVEKSRAALAIEDQPRLRVLLAGCLQKSGKLLAALAEARGALQAGLKKKDIELAKASAALLEDLLKKIPRITFVPPTTGGVTGFQATFDGKPIPAASFNKQISVDPGSHAVHAEGISNGIKLVFDQTYDVKPADQITVQITLKPESPKYLTEGQMQCMRSAKTQDDVAACLPSGSKPLNVRLGVDMGAYIDTTATRVATPGVHAGISSPTAGWNVGASYLVDFVSSASPDIVSTASRNFTDTRHAVSVNGGFKPGRFGFDAAGSFSAESDYISRSAHVAVMGDFADKRVTPRVGVGRIQDTLGRAGQGFSDYSHAFYTNDVDVGATFVLTPSSVFVVGLEAAFERGDQSKPYRLVPLFDSSTYVPPGATVDSVNANRLPVRTYEQLPLDRDRYALSGRFLKRFRTTTLRLEQRIYRDSWQILATTTDVRYIVDLGTRLSVWPHAHLHGQTGANFYQRAYRGEIAPVVQVPIFRTTDRELSPFVSLTLGGGARYDLSASNARFRYALTLAADAMQSRYFDAIYIRNRLAVYGTLGFEVEFE